MESIWVQSGENLFLGDHHRSCVSNGKNKLPRTWFLLPLNDRSSAQLRLPFIRAGRSSDECTVNKDSSNSTLSHTFAFRRTLHSACVICAARNRTFTRCQWVDVRLFLSHTVWWIHSCARERNVSTWEIVLFSQPSIDWGVRRCSALDEVIFSFLFALTRVWYKVESLGKCDNWTRTLDPHLLPRHVACVCIHTTV